MIKIILCLILTLSLSAFGRTKSASLSVLKNSSKEKLSTLISTFNILTENDGLHVEISNMTGQKKNELLKTRTEQYKEYSRYSLLNPFTQETQNLDLYIFEKIKPILADEHQSKGADTDFSDMRIDLHVLLDSGTKKTIKTKAVVYYKDFLVAEGSVDNNTQIQIKDNLSTKVKNYAIQEMKITKNLLNSDKRSLDLEVRFAQNGRQFKQKLNVNLLNMTQTPIKEELPEDSLEDEGEKDETDNSNS